MFFNFIKRPRIFILPPFSFPTYAQSFTVLSPYCWNISLRKVATIPLKLFAYDNSEWETPQNISFTGKPYVNSGYFFFLLLIMWYELNLLVFLYTIIIIFLFLLREYSFLIISYTPALYIASIYGVSPNHYFQIHSINNCVQCNCARVHCKQSTRTHTRLILFQHQLTY